MTAPRKLTLVRLLLAIFVVVGVLFVSAMFWVRNQLQAGLPPLSGTHPTASVQADVAIERDLAGVPTIRGENRIDVAFATGFVHGQDRFFQMDLTRRLAAGELSAVLGSSTVEVDRSMRIHRFRHRAGRVLDRLSPSDRQLLTAYTEGVNAGLGSIKGVPFEYLMLQQQPESWKPEDTLLTIYAMFWRLQADNWPRESTYGSLAESLPESVYRFVAPAGTEWDAPLLGPAFVPPAPPGPDQIDLRARQKQARRMGPEPALTAWGSNNWAVAGTQTADGRAILANDMHLGISVPNTWYRASLHWKDDAGNPHEITGVTLPGTPAVVVGSNRRVAWGFTNTQADFADLVILKENDDQTQYLTPDGWQSFETFPEIIGVKDGESQTLEIEETIWGPVFDTDDQGRRRVLRWTAHDPEAIDLGIRELELLRTVEEAIDRAQRTGIPPQNFVVADADGSIGWTIIGRIPRRIGYDGRIPTDWSDGTRSWEGWLAPEEYPFLINPESGRLWTANHRTVDGEWLERLGDGGFVLGARAQQIRDGLAAMKQPTERGLLDLQLDDRALFLKRWQELLLDVLREPGLKDHPKRDELEQLVKGWGGRAAAGSVGYRAVREFRSQAALLALGPFLDGIEDEEGELPIWRLSQYEGPLWQLVTQRPSHLLASEHADWPTLLTTAVEKALEELTRDDIPLPNATWGFRNTARIRHPLSRAIPALAKVLDMPAEPLSGDVHMPRVQTPTSGASERIVVSPGREEDGYFHMPTGQSGHFMSPHYRDGHEDWVEGRPTPFLPGPPANTLVLQKADTAGADTR